MDKKSLFATQCLQSEIVNNQPDIDKIVTYIKEGAEVNYQNENGYTSLMLATQKNEGSIVDLLLQSGADPLIKNHHQLIASDFIISTSLTYQLLKNYELLFSTARSDVLHVKKVLETGANVNFQGQEGYTALMIAVEQSLLELVEILLVNKADLSIELNDGRDVFDLVKDPLIYKILDYGKPYSLEQKKMYFKLVEEEALEEETWDKFREKTVTARRNKPFDVSDLHMRNFLPPPNKSELDELEAHFGHPIPLKLKEIFIKYNGGEPKLAFFGEHGEGTLNYFYFLNEDRDNNCNIWKKINIFSAYLGSETLPFAEDNYGGIYYLKWNEAQAQVWLFQYGDQLFLDLDNYDIDLINDMPIDSTFISNSIDIFLEELYEG